jgi:hypothetical protein
MPSTHDLLPVRGAGHVAGSPGPPPEGFGRCLAGGHHTDSDDSSPGGMRSERTGEK